MTILVACGLAREAALIAGKRHDVVTVAGGGDAARLERGLARAIAIERPALLLSSGIAGGLDPGLRAGAVVIDGDWALVAQLHAILPDAVVGKIAGSDTIVANVADKRALHARTGAAALDMETHIAARVAARHRIRFAAIRVVSDGANAALPPAALLGMRPDGGIAVRAVLGSLARHPAQLAALIRTGRHAGIAFRELGRVHHLLARAGIGRLDLGEFAFDMR